MRSKVHPKYKTKYRVGNWSAYEQALVQRGDVTLWLSADATDAWRPSPSGRPGAPKQFSDCAIETALTLRLVFRLPLRQPAPLEEGGRLPSPGAGGECVLSVQINYRGSASRPVPRRASGRVRGRVSRPEPDDRARSARVVQYWSVTCLWVGIVDGQFRVMHQRQSTALGIGPAKRPRAQVLPEIRDQIVLVAVHPASERENEEL